MNRSDKRRVDNDSTSIQVHLTIMQDVIQRMAANSSSAKTWCVTLVSAVLVIVADKGKPQYAWIAMLPTIIFSALDMYYLALEKGFRRSYNEFIDKLHAKSLMASDLYSVQLSGNFIKLLFESIQSFSIWGFYVSMAILTIVTKKVAIG
jgi:hypothetical protein